MNKIKCLLISVLIFYNGHMKAQDNSDIALGVASAAAITFVAIKANKKEIAKEITQFRSKEYIINNIIGPTNGKTVRFETESLASDNSGGLISVAFNCNEVNQRGLLLAFFGDNTDKNGNLMTAFGFRYLPLKEAQDLIIRLNKVVEDNKKYISSDNDVNNVYIEHEEIKFVIYRDGGKQIRVFWNGFEVIWEETAFKRTERRLNKWFD